MYAFATVRCFGEFVWPCCIMADYKVVFYVGKKTMKKQKSLHILCESIFFSVHCQKKIEREKYYDLLSVRFFYRHYDVTPTLNHVLFH